jgi:hypothetical protein
MANTTFAAAPIQSALSNGNLTIAHSNSTQGGGRSVDFQSSGKYYFELTLTTVGGANTLVGLAHSMAGVSELIAGHLSVSACYKSNGNIWGNGSASGFTLGALANGDIIGVAVDFTNSKIWYRKSPSGNWDGNAAHDPATNTNGVSFSSMPAGAAPAIVWAGAGMGATETITANFGGSAFSGTVPSGFTSGWPGPSTGGASRARAYAGL